MKIFGIFALVLILFGTIATSTAGSNQTGTWSSPIQLSGYNQSAWFPAIETDAYGTIHVVWSQNIAPNDTVMYTSSQDGVKWSPPNDIVALPTDRGSEATRPHLLYNPHSDTLNLSYHSYDIFTAEASVQDTWNSNAWNTYAIINDRSQNAYYSRSSIDSRNTHHILVTWNVPTPDCEICYHVFYRNRPNDGYVWSDPIDISMPNTGSAKPILFVDDQDYLHAVWESSDFGGGSYGTVGRPSYILYAKSMDNGESWSTPEVISSSIEEAKNPTISMDSRGQLITVWLGLPDDVVYYQLSLDRGDTWSTPNPLPGILGGFTIYNSLLDTYSTAIDSEGNVHLVLVGRLIDRDRQLHLFHTAWDGSSWSEPEIIVTYSADVPEWPQISISNGNRINLVWFLRDAEHVWDTENGKYTIWYAQSITPAAYIPPKQFPTKAVEISSTPAIRAEPTLTITIPPPTATPAYHYTPDKNVTYKEKHYLKVMGYALIPIVMFLILVMIIVFKRRR